MTVEFISASYANASIYARGASAALVGSPQTIADSILDHADLGADLISVRGDDKLNDAIDDGRDVLPPMRATPDRAR
ncbi:alkanesulfonate monooxygenase SsuD/methylene tetrahydromethanopterin reductase-like flavin-dependent oxidoreductase (luciferase family) [Rhizobium sp. BK602]|nr:alkanesulfonate monooxygenase SsuD/methylene tetrahydromethanopterin reductase-like flavin-dependent oxidoreductase (luciferase family) [Rhizobium sp. BK602]